MRLARGALVLAAAGACALPAALPAAAEPVVPALGAAQKRPGYGLVERVVAVRVAPERSAAAGGSAPGASEEARPMYRVQVRMADGSVQYRDLDRPEFKPGDRVLLTNAGDILPD